MSKNEVFNENDSIIQDIMQIPQDVDRLQLVELLKPVLQKLAQIDEPESNAIMDDIIKRRFDLKTHGMQGYRKFLNRLRRKCLSTLDKPSAKTSSNVEYIAKFNGLVDIVDHEEKLVFLVKQEGKLIIQSSVTIENRTYSPPPRNQILWLPGRAEEVQRYYSIYHEGISVSDLAEMLFDEIVQYLKDISDLPSEAYYHLLAAWIMHTYLMDKFNYSPIICLHAVPDRGKSRTGKGLIYCAFRGAHLESLNEAHIFRLADNFDASLFFDIVDIVKKMVEMKSEDIVLSRYERGLKVPRVLYPEKGRFKDTEYFEVFGPTVIAINKSANHIMKTRSITINMPDTKRSFEEDVVPEMALELKEKLLAFRAYYMEMSLPNIKKPSRKRLGDILKPLLQIIIMVKPEIEESFRALVKDLEEERKTDKVDSYEGSVLQAIADLEDDVKNGILSIKDITDRANAGKSDKEKFSYSTVGKILSSLGFQKKRGTRSGGSAIIWNDDLFSQLLDQYGIVKASDISEPSEVDTDITDSSDANQKEDVDLFDEYL